MNYFEQELRRLAKVCGELKNPVFAGRACLADLGGDNRVKLEFVTGIVADKYNALKATVLNRTDGVVDILQFRFADTWGKKPVPGNPNFKDGVIPYIWTYNGQSEWYAYRPTDADIRQLATEVGGYLAVFAAHDRVPEKTQPESVVKKIRESKQAPATSKTPSGKKKTEPEL